MTIRRIIRYTLLTLGALVLIVGGAIAWHTWPRTREFYSDAEAIKRPVEQTTAREILWKPPAMLPGWATAMADEYEPRLSDDGLTLYFVRGKVGGKADIYSARRTSNGWTGPLALKGINSDRDDLGPEIAPDGNTLYFYSDRPGGQGGYDIWMSRKADNKWQTPINLGANVNSAYNDYGVAVAPDSRTIYYSSNRPRPDSKAPASDAWTATLREDLYHHDYDIYAAAIVQGEPAAAQFLDKLNTSSNEGAPAVSPAGDFLYFCSDRPGGIGGFDLYRARRINGAIERPDNLGDSINTPAAEMDPALAMGGYSLYFSSNRKSPDSSATSDRYRLYWSSSREVFIQVEQQQARIDWAALWAAIGPNLMWGLLALILFLLMLALMNDLRRRQLSLLVRCLLASLMIHLLLMLLFNAWQVTASISGLLDKPGGIKIALTSAARADDLAIQIRGQLTDVDTPSAEWPIPERAEPAPLTTLASSPVKLSIEQVETQLAFAPSAIVHVPDRTPEIPIERTPVKFTEESAPAELAIDLPADSERINTSEASPAVPEVSTESSHLPAPTLTIATSQPARESTVHLSPESQSSEQSPGGSQSLASMPTAPSTLPRLPESELPSESFASLDQPPLEAGLPSTPSQAREKAEESISSAAQLAPNGMPHADPPSIAAPSVTGGVAHITPQESAIEPGSSRSIAAIPSDSLAASTSHSPSPTDLVSTSMPTGGLFDQPADTLDLALPIADAPQPEPAAVVAVAPTGQVIGTLHGRVTSAATNEPLVRAAVSVNVLGEPVAAMIAMTDDRGMYILRLPVVPDMFAVSTSKRGYLPTSENVEARRLDSGDLEMNFRLSPATSRIIAIEQQPEVHHLGNDRFEGSINSQFQKESDGLTFEAEFQLTPEQCPPAISRAAVLLMAKGVQCPHKIRINGQTLRRRLRTTSEDGSFSRFTATFSADLLHPGTNTIEVMDVYCNDDLDDFEFVNVQIRLSP
jgi:hypothetical protein